MIVNSSGLDHHVVVLDAHSERLGDIRPLDQLRALLDRHAEAPRLDLVGVAPRLAGADIELPGVPGAAEYLAAAGIVLLARLVRQHEAGEIALAQAAAAMRTTVRQCEELT